MVFTALDVESICKRNRISNEPSHFCRRVAAFGHDFDLLWQGTKIPARIFLVYQISVVSPVLFNARTDGKAQDSDASK
jgi:hypothetical protein